MTSLSQNPIEVYKSLNPRDDRRLKSESWRHQFYNLLWAESERLFAAGEIKSSVYYARSATALLECSDPALFCNVVVCSDDESHFIRPVCQHCDGRLCPICAPVLAAALVAGYAEIAKNALRAAPHGYSLKHLVFTTPYRHDHPDIKNIRRRLQKSVYVALEKILGVRQRNWKKRFIGVLVSWEFGPNGKKLHFHVDLLSPFIGSGHKAEVWNVKTRQMSRIHDGKLVVSDAWYEATGGECSITYLHMVARPADGVREAVKYVTKLTELPPADALLLFGVLHETDSAGRVKTVHRVRSLGIFCDAPEEWKNHQHQGEVKCWCGALLTARKRRAGDLHKIAAFDEGAAADAALLDLRPGNPDAGIGNGNPVLKANPPPQQLLMLPPDQDRRSFSDLQNF